MPQNTHGGLNDAHEARRVDVLGVALVELCQHRLLKLGCRRRVKRVLRCGVCVGSGSWRKGRTHICNANDVRVVHRDDAGVAHLASKGGDAEESEKDEKS